MSSPLRQTDPMLTLRRNIALRQALGYDQFSA
jgi:hypothetical protein